ncbi:MAG: DUF1638 domain-containing protein [Spirochaetaceae bacterium]|jgi:hypothetical protein|nr:DUF1638 domain-containing protein [Spirochaetaceae bacterium]
MDISIVSCGIFRYELEKLLPEIEVEAGCRLEVDFLAPALDVNAARLEEAVAAPLSRREKQPVVLLYGNMCHTEWPRITGKSGALYPNAANCVEMLLSPEEKKAIDAEGNVYFLTMGGLRQWKEIYQQGHGWDASDARVNFGYFDKIVLLDTGVFEISDEDLFEFFEFTQIPIEVMQISLDYFKTTLLTLCTRLTLPAE